MIINNRITAWGERKVTAIIVMADGTVIEGVGAGATGEVVGEVCFNTSMTGYEEILTDPSYRDQIVTFTFPHIGNVGANREDIEDLDPVVAHFGAVGAIFRADISEPSNYRAQEHFDAWLKKRGIIAITGVDTRALTAYLRQNGAVNAVIAFSPDAQFNRVALAEKAKNWPGLVDLDLAKLVTTKHNRQWSELPWRQRTGYDNNDHTEFHIVAVDYGIKRNILRLLANLKAKVTIVPAQSTAAEILALKPDGVFLSNGPGDPAATAKYSLVMIKEVIAHGLPLFGICLGHQLLALALGAQTIKMHQGHHGANHPVKDLVTGKVEIVSMNHGFAVDSATLPPQVIETHQSLFDGSNCGIAVKEKPVFSVQYHPEASPGPEDSHYLFDRFRQYLVNYKQSILKQ